MAKQIGKPTFVTKVPSTVDFPTLMAQIATNEIHIGHLIDIQVTTNLIQLIAQRAIQLQDPILIKILVNMELVHYIPKEEIENESKSNAR